MLAEVIKTTTRGRHAATACNEMSSAPFLRVSRDPLSVVVLQLGQDLWRALRTFNLGRDTAMKLVKELSRRLAKFRNSDWTLSENKQTEPLKQKKPSRDRTALSKKDQANAQTLAKPSAPKTMPPRVSPPQRKPWPAGNPDANCAAGYTSDLIAGTITNMRAYEIWTSFLPDRRPYLHQYPFRIWTVFFKIYDSRVIQIRQVFTEGFEMSKDWNNSKTRILHNITEYIKYSAIFESGKLENFSFSLKKVRIEDKL